MVVFACVFHGNVWTQKPDLAPWVYDCLYSWKQNSFCMPFSVFNFEEFLKLEGKGGGEKTSHKTKQDWLLFPVNKNQDFSFYVFSSLIPQLCLSGMWYSKLCHTSCLWELFLLRNTPIQANEIASAFLLLKLVHSCIARLQMWYLCFCVMFSLLLHYFFVTAGILYSLIS